MKKFLFITGITAVAVLTSANLAYAERTTPAIFYVDSRSGSDAGKDTKVSDPWRSLKKVNQQTKLVTTSRCGDRPDWHKIKQFST